MVGMLTAKDVVEKEQYDRNFFYFFKKLHLYHQFDIIQIDETQIGFHTLNTSLKRVELMLIPVNMLDP